MENGVKKVKGLRITYNVLSPVPVPEQVIYKGNSSYNS